MNTPAKNHIGRKISRIRELKGIKQEALAFALGMSQQSVSALENSEELDEKKLQAIAVALNVPVEAIKNFSEEGMVTYFNNFSENSGNNIFATNYTSFNPIDKLVEVFEENKKLYERLLESEREKISYLENLLKLR